MDTIKIIENEDLEYIAEVKDNDNIKLRYSNSDIWTSDTKGSHIGKLKDTGNNIKIKINDKKIKLDYSEFEYLLTLITLKNTLDDGFNIKKEFIK